MGRHSHSRCRVNAIAPATFALLASVSANAAPVDDMRTLVEAGNAEEACTRCATIDVDAEPRADLGCGNAAVDVAGFFAGPGGSGIGLDYYFNARGGGVIEGVVGYRRCAGAGPC
jgi:hypothetical protein